MRDDEGFANRGKEVFQRIIDPATLLQMQPKPKVNKGSEVLGNIS